MTAMLEHDQMTMLLFLFALQLRPSAPICALHKRLETWPVAYIPLAKA